MVKYDQKIPEYSIKEEKGCRRMQGSLKRFREKSKGYHLEKGAKIISTDSINIEEYLGIEESLRMQVKVKL